MERHHTKLAKMDFKVLRGSRQNDRLFRNTVRAFEVLYVAVGENYVSVEPFLLYQWDFFLVFNISCIALKDSTNITNINLRITSSLVFDSCPKITSLQRENKDILNK